MGQTCTRHLAGLCVCGVFDANLDAPYMHAPNLKNLALSKTAIYRCEQDCPEHKYNEKRSNTKRASTECEE